MQTLKQTTVDFFFCIFEGEEAICQQRYRQPGNQKRNKQGRRHGQRQCLEKSTGHASQKCQWHKNNQGRGARAGQWRHKFQCRFKHPLVDNTGTVLKATYDMFNHDDRIVDNQPDSSGHTTQSHNIKAHPQHIQQHHGRRQYRRHDYNGDQSDFEITQKKQQDQRRQQHTDQHGFQYARGRFQDQLALVIPVCNDHASRQLGRRRCQLLFDIVDDLNAVATRLLIDRKQYGVFAISSHTCPLRRGGQLHCSDIGEPNQSVGLVFDDQSTELIDIFKTAVRDGQK